MLKLTLAKNKMENEEGMNHVLVSVTPELSTEKIEKPIAFMLVVDASGSMDDRVGGYSYNPNPKPFNPMKFERIIQGEVSTKLDYVKQASERLVDMMKEGDMLGVVSFSDTASLEYPLTAINQDVRFKLKDRIRKLQTRGMTNISDGLEMAYRQIPNELKETHHIKLLLLSDGHANYGITNPDGIGSLVSTYRQNDVSVSTIGVGDTYNSYFMEVTATASGGMFYHLKDVTKLNDLFTAELETLTALTTKQATLSVDFGNGIKQEENLNGFKEEDGRIFLGNVFAEQKVLIELYTEEKINTGNRSIKATLEYTNQHGEKKVIEQSVQLDIVLEEDMTDVKTDDKVVALVKQMMEAKTKKEALRAYEMGDVVNATGLVQTSMLRMNKIKESYDVDVDGLFADMTSFEESLSTRSLDNASVKSLYSASYKMSRNMEDHEE